MADGFDHLVVGLREKGWPTFLMAGDPLVDIGFQRRGQTGIALRSKAAGWGISPAPRTATLQAPARTPSAAGSIGGGAGGLQLITKAWAFDVTRFGVLEQAVPSRCGCRSRCASPTGPDERFPWNTAMNCGVRAPWRPARIWPRRAVKSPLKSTGRGRRWVGGRRPASTYVAILGISRACRTTTGWRSAGSRDSDRKKGQSNSGRLNGMNAVAAARPSKW